MASSSPESLVSSVIAHFGRLIPVIVLCITVHSELSGRAVCQVVCFPREVESSDCEGGAGGRIGVKGRVRYFGGLN
ncbi:uncharacterized protein EI97DRAFT_496210 [Westerdykella ornata]|uniref:Uncharacterized protein n=1 Tax=Westerdykella ornata TaxID=318751 RepID=A0A6A6J963_WESOR|nr:uncharacterized protein EI97DRAFT_496210 [Westerdykella ornata]KAF2273110.1 hypothetical protein EI97DRAFT_496210 [Westerdykella ornata]